MSGFLSMHCFKLFGDANFSRYSKIVSAFGKVKWKCDSCVLKSTWVRELNVESSKESC